jgi:hypothetical protein
MDDYTELLQIAKEMISPKEITEKIKELTQPFEENHEDLVWADVNPEDLKKFLDSLFENRILTTLSLSPRSEQLYDLRDLLGDEDYSLTIDEINYALHNLNINKMGYISTIKERKFDKEIIPFLNITKIENMIPQDNKEIGKNYRGMGSGDGGAISPVDYADRNARYSDVSRKNIETLNKKF